MSLIELKKVQKSFGCNKVLREVNLKIKKGRLTGIKGESGAGKTTLLRLLAGQTGADKGEIYYKFKTKKYPLVEVKNLDEFHNKMGFSCQEGSFYDELSVSENLEYFGVLHGIKSKLIEPKIKKILSLVNLSEWGSVLSGDLSAGMQKRLDIACTLMHEPQVVFLDEPTAHLDRGNQKEIWKLVRKINNKGVTVLVTSHFPKDLERHCDKVYNLKQGKLK